MVNRLHFYDHGFPFSRKLCENVDDCIDRVSRNKASCIVIDGGVGEGKTTLAIEIADYINRKHFLPEVELKMRNHPQIAMGGKQFAQQMRDCFDRGLPVIIYDEGGDYAKRGAMSSFNSFLNRIFETYRAFKIIVIICLPNMYMLENALFDNRIPRLIIHCHGRTKHDGDFKAYSLHRAFYLRFNMKKFEDKNFAYQVVEPNFVGHFLNITKERATAIDALTIAGKLDILHNAEMKLEGLIPLKEVAIRLGVTPEYTFKLCMENNIQADKQIGVNNFYYEPRVVEHLESIMARGFKPDKEKVKKDARKKK